MAEGRSKLSDNGYENEDHENDQEKNSPVGVNTTEKVRLQVHVIEAGGLD